MGRKPRRIVAVILIVLGGLLMWLTPDLSVLGLAVLLLGAGVEIAGIYLEHQDRNKS